MAIKDLTVNAWGNNSTEYLNAVQGESGSRFAEVHLNDSAGQPIDLTGCTPRFFVKNGAAEPPFVDGEIIDAANGVVKFVTNTSDMVKTAGEFPCEILLSGENYSPLKFQGITLRVKASNLESAVQSGNQYSSLVIALNSISSSVAAAQDAVTKANAAIQTANDASTAANTAADNAKTKATLADAAAAAANTSASNADAKATLAGTAADNANAKATAADSAATRANTAAAACEGVITGDLTPAVNSALANLKDKDGGIAGYDGVKAHENNTTVHITADERTAWNSKASKSTPISATLAVANWSGTSAPYTITVTATGLKAEPAPTELLPGAGFTTDQLTALQAANIVKSDQSDGSIVLYAYGDKPSIDIPVEFIVRGDL